MKEVEMKVVVVCEWRMPLLFCLCVLPCYTYVGKGGG